MGAHHLIPSSCQRRRHGKLSLGEMLFIMVLFHISPYKDFKHFWHYGINQQYRHYFGQLPSYSRFVRLMPRLLLPLYMLLQYFRGEQTGIYFADSTKLAVCHNARISRNRVFQGMAKRGRNAMGWSSASSSTCSSTTRASSWPSRSPLVVPMTANRFRP